MDKDLWFLLMGFSMGFSVRSYFRGDSDIQRILNFLNLIFIVIMGIIYLHFGVE